MSLKDKISGELPFFWVLAALFILALFFVIQVRLDIKPILEGDANGYYSQVVSFIFDRSFWWMERQVLLNPQRGHYHSVPVGTALLWAPFFSLFHLLSIILSKLGFAVSTDPMSLFHRFSAYFANLLYSFIGIALTFRLLRSHYPIWISGLCSLAAVAGTATLNTTIWQTTMNHAPSFFAVTLFIYYWHQQRNDPTARSMIILGLAGGMMILVRWQNGLFLILPLLDMIWRLYQAMRSRNFIIIPRIIGINALIIPSALIGFSPQIIYWQYIHEKLFVYYYAGSSFLRPQHPKLLSMFFSTNHGLLVWTPFLGIGLIGLIIGARRRLLLISLLIAFFMQAYINSCVKFYGIGMHYGLRQFACVTAIIAFGAAELLQQVSGRRLSIPTVALYLVLVAYNALFLHQFASGYIPTVGELSFRQILTDKIRLLSTGLKPLEVDQQMAKEHKFLMALNLSPVDYFTSLAGKPDFIVKINRSYSRGFVEVDNQEAPFIAIYSTPRGYASYLFENGYMSGVFRSYEDRCYCDDRFIDFTCDGITDFLEPGMGIEETAAFLNISLPDDNLETIERLKYDNVVLMFKDGRLEDIMYSLSR